METKKDEKEWIVRERGKKVKSHSIDFGIKNEKNKNKLSRKASVNIIPSWERRQHHSITNFFKQSTLENKNKKNIFNNVASSTKGPVQERVSNERRIIAYTQENIGESKITHQTKIEPMSQLSCNEGIKIAQNDKNKDCHLQELDSDNNDKTYNLQSSFHYSNDYKSDVKHIYNQCYDLNEIFDVPKFPNKVKTLEEKLRNFDKIEHNHQVFT